MSKQSKVKVKSRKEEKKASLFIYNYDIKHRIGSAFVCG